METPEANGKPPLTIDQRLEKLLERHESLSHSVELLAGMQIKTEKEIRRLGRYVRMIVLDHEARLLALEGDDNNEDGEQDV